MFKKVIWLTGMPRSGTNWLSQIIFSHPDVRLKFCPLFSYEFKNELDENSEADEWRHLFKKVYKTKSEYLDQEYLRREGLIPTFSQRNPNPSVLAIKSTRFHNLTHGLLKKCPDIIWVAIVRNPNACIHSWLSNKLEFPADADPLTEWRSGACRKNGPGEFWGFEDWKFVTSMFLELEAKYPDRFRILRYETLVQSAQRQTQLLFDWLGFDFPKQTFDFLSVSQDMHNNHSRSVFKLPSTIDRWLLELDTQISNQIIKELKDTPLSVFLQSGSNKAY